MSLAVVHIQPRGGAPGLERFEARLSGGSFAPHRHDCYAIGLTVQGVQRFRFRGARWDGLPGQVHVLHPDETHDGEPGTAGGFAYRMVYLDPVLVGKALGGAALPFVETPLLDGADPSSWNFDAPLDELSAHDLVQALAELLASASGGHRKAPVLDRAALARVRECIAADAARPPSLPALERVAGLDRWTLARQFRQAYGVSPSAYRVQRQVAQAQRLMCAGLSLADVAAASGFSDQSHLGRQFLRTTGLTPARWRSALGSTPGRV